MADEDSVDELPTAENEAEAAAAADPELFSQTIKGVQIFRAGNWNGKKYTTKDIDSMIKASTEIGFRPPVKLGHTDEQDAPAYGWVTNLRRDNDTLLADFEHVPDDLVEQIKQRHYDQVSSEILFDFDYDGKKYHRALRAVAVLGAKVPGVANLKPLSEFLSLFTAADRYECITEETPEMTTKPDAGAADDVAKLQADLAATTADLAAMNAKFAQLETTAAQAATLQLKLQEADEREKKRDRLFAQLAEKARQEQIDNLVKGLARPKYRNNIRALAELALRATDAADEALMVAFAATDDVEASATDAFGVLTDLVRKMNADVEPLLREHIRSGNPTERRAGGLIDDPAAELMALIGDYKRANPGVDHEIAKHAVTSNPKYRSIVERLNNVTRMAN